MGAELTIGVAILGVAALLGCALVWKLVEVILLGEQSAQPGIPPISDEEFLARLPKGTDRDIALRVRTIVAEQTGADRESIYPETRFVDLCQCFLP